MPTRNVVITDHQAAFLEGLVASGRFQNVSEAVRDGLRRLEADEAEFQEQRARILESLAQAERGEFAEGTGEEVFARALARALAAAEADE
jgi:antitoxin ParD1/3/4